MAMHLIYRLLKFCTGVHVTWHYNDYSRDWRWRHMTLKGHDHDANTPIILTRVEDRLRLWLALNGVMGATSGVETGPLSADDFAKFFQDKVNAVRASTASTPVFDVPFRETPTLEQWSTVTSDEVERLISSVIIRLVNGVQRQRQRCLERGDFFIPGESLEWGRRDVVGLGLYLYCRKDKFTLGEKL